MDAALILALSAAASAVTAGEEPAPPGPRIENEHLALRFAPPGAGMGLVALEHRSGGGEAAAFVTAKPEDATVWRLVLRGPLEKDEEVRIDSRAPCRRSATVEPAGGAALAWEGIDLPGEPGAIDVAVRVALPPGSLTSLWKIAVTNRSAKRGPWEVHFPAFAGFGEKGKIDLGIPRGNWGTWMKGLSAPVTGYYPSNDWPMQFLLAGKGDRGMLLEFRDPAAWPKRFRADPGGEISFTIYPEDMGKPGAPTRPPFDVALEAYRGSWWVGAKRYREWALGAPWARRGPIASRKDFPDALRRTALWWLAGGTREEVVPKMKAAAARFDVPLAVHWYNWHVIPFDVNYPEYFPAKPGFAEGVRDLVAAGQTVMPYINGRLWDAGGPNFPAALPAAAKRPGGKESYVETYGSGANLAPMCPATSLWQAKVGEVVKRLGEECGVNAVYIDQIGSAGPVLCHDPAHGHPLGGGGHWVEGYRKMLEPIRDLAAARGMVLTTENDAEPYMDTIDGYLIWLPRSEDEIPLIAAVYSGRAVYFSSPSRGGMEADAFVMVQGRDLLWGCQLGWMGFELLEPDRKEQADYLLECGRYRRALEKFLLGGELLGELALAEPPPIAEAMWGTWQGVQRVKIPSVTTAVWRAPDGTVAVLAANLSRDPRTISYDLDGAAWGIPAGAAGVKIARLRPGKREELGEAALKSRRKERLAPREILALEVSPR